MSQSSRALMPDYLRLFALFGIVVVNVQTIAFSFEGDMFAPKDRVSDALTMFLVYGLAFSKSFGLFSFMFGVGLGFLMQAAERKGLSFGKVYRNRMIGLILLGVAHGCLFYPGDILLTYGLIGSILYFVRNWPVKRLVWVGSLLLLFQALVLAPIMAMGAAIVTHPEIMEQLIGQPLDDYYGDIVEIEREALTNGSFFDAIAMRATSFANFVGFTIFLQGTIVLGWFCLGLAAVKAGAIDNAGHKIWRRARVFALVPGVLASLVGAAIWQWHDAVLGVAIVIAVGPLATMGYLGLIAHFARPPGPFIAKALAAGGSSLTIYLGQSIVLSTIFAGYGLGLWEALSPAMATLTAVCVTVALMIFVTIWRQRFKLGPFEWVLRKITYFGTAKS